MPMARLLVALCLALCALAARAESAGQIMFAYGETLALRAGRIVNLHAGAGVESGDQIHTGVDSYLQIRFTDWSTISLRPRTDFVIDDYAYQSGAGGVERAFFSLLSGGVRSLTGLIGHRNRSHYRMRTITTAIGIRGTHYSVLICNQDCRNEDGTLGEDGVYGGVIDGRIAVSPYGGAALEREFDAGEYFRLVSATSVPEKIFVPPSFFWDRLEPQARLGGRSFAGVPWKPAPGVSAPGASGDPTDIAGSLLRADGSLALSSITAPVLNQIALPMLSQTTSQLGTTVNALAAPVAPLLGSTVSGLLGSPAVAPALTLAGAAIGSVAAPVAPVIGSTVGLVTTPVAPVIGSVGAIAGPAVTPVVAPVAPIVAPVITPPASTVTLPSLPTLPVTGGLPSLLPKK